MNGVVDGIEVRPKIVSELEPDFCPAVLWNQAFEQRCLQTGEAEDLAIAVERPDGSVSCRRTLLLPHVGDHVALNHYYVDRLLKFMLWQKGGSRIYIGGNESLATTIKDSYSAQGARRFEWKMLGERTYLEAFTVTSCAIDEVPESKEEGLLLGRHLEGCRIGFDLGGSDRKCAAVIDGEIVHSEEVAWNPYFETDPQYHYDGIMDSIRRAAEKLPRVDAIGGSAAGIYVNSEPRVASLFRGISEKKFDQYVRPIFHRIQEEWGNVPFEVVNDGAVTALAGSMSLNDNAVLGLALGTSLAVGYCDWDGHVSSGLDELCFVPVDYRPDAPADEWSGDIGCGVQYLSQQAVARLAPRAGIELPEDMPLAERLIEVQERMARGDDGARQIYETIGVFMGYAIAHFASFYDLRHVLILGRVTTGEGGNVIRSKAVEVLAAEFPEQLALIRLHIPDEKLKRHGQAIAAASLPALRRTV